jgi:hypothetical protein|tara:strand:+ start:568 stop:972 length:405 start_codon:yes stop_codon:yes gene_type:complete
MKKSELKNMIKECVKEVIFEEGVLSGIIAEVAHGLQGSNLVQESRRSLASDQRDVNKSSNPSEAKRQVISAISKNSYEDLKNKFSNPQLFEGTKPIPTGTGQGALSGQTSSDPGVNINNLPGMRNWGAVVTKMK